MKYEDVLAEAKKVVKEYCRVCKDCNGKACVGEVPGVGGKASGAAFTRSREQLNAIKINLDTIIEEKPIDTSVELFGKRFKYPVFPAPIGAVALNYGSHMDDYTYSMAILEGSRQAGIIGFTGDGVKDEYYDLPIKAINEVGGLGIPTIKPWKQAEVLAKIKKAEQCNATAVAMDIDAAGLLTLALLGKPVGTKSVAELKEIISATELPVILKGIMTVAGAQKALAAGAYGIVVSNHGGRVLDHTPATIEVLAEISRTVKGKMKIFIDGGFRTGSDVFKALALGADAVIIGRPYVLAAYGGGAEGVKLYTEKLGQELLETMLMTGCHSLADIDESKVYIR